MHAPAPRDVIPVSRLTPRPFAFTTYSGIPDSTRLVVRDTLAWLSTWRQINRPFLPPPAPPAIDFTREMVVVAALGNRPSEGYDVVFEDAVEDSVGLEIGVRVVTPAGGCPVNASVTQPVDLARIPASARPVRFRQRNVVVPCGVR
jgi:hypothetical protein